MNFIIRTLDAGARNLPETKPKGIDFEMCVYKGRCVHEEEKN
jgi:hypothetical protein